MTSFLDCYEPLDSQIKKLEIDGTALRKKII